MKVLRVLTVLMFGAVASTCAAGDLNDPKSTFVIDRPITGPAMAPIMAALDKLLIAEDKPESINLVIDSPGGSIFVGNALLAKMAELQKGGVKFHCFVPNLAASMAFSILMECDTRTVLNRSTLLWHRAAIQMGGMGGRMTSYEMLSIGSQLKDVDDQLLQELSTKLRPEMDFETVLYHFDHETMHVGQTLCSQVTKFCKSQAAIPGLMRALVNPKLIHAAKPMSLMDLLGGKKAEIVYIWSQAMEEILNATKGTN